MFFLLDFAEEVHSEETIAEKSLSGTSRLVR